MRALPQEGYRWLPSCCILRWQRVWGTLISSLHKRALFPPLKLHLMVFSLVTQSCPTLCDPMNHSTPGLPVHHQLPESIETHVHCVGDAIQPSHPLSSPSPPALKVSQHQGLSNESALHIRWPKYWSFSFNISSSNEHPGLISLPKSNLDLLNSLPANTITMKIRVFNM